MMCMIKYNRYAANRSSILLTLKPSIDKRSRRLATVCILSRISLLPFEIGIVWLWCLRLRDQTQRQLIQVELGLGRSQLWLLVFLNFSKPTNILFKQTTKRPYKNVVNSSSKAKRSFSKNHKIHPANIAPFANVFVFSTTLSI